MGKINIAIDGHAGSGKGLICSILAEKLNFRKLDTGALYRGIACEWTFQNLGVVSTQKISKFVKNLEVYVEFDYSGKQLVYVNGRNHTSNLRHENISNLTPIIAKYPKIREVVRGLQINFAKENDCIIEGRDIGSEILPNADVKFFVTASPQVRAERRCLQNAKNGEISNFDQVLEDIKKRDYSDENRAISPLKKCDDAILVDNSGEIDDVIDNCMDQIKSKLSSLEK